MVICDVIYYDMSYMTHIEHFTHIFVVYDYMIMAYVVYNNNARYLI